jgi:hypothetical protein
VVVLGGAGLLEPSEISNHQCQKNSSHSNTAVSHRVKARFAAHPSQKAYLKCHNEINASVTAASLGALVSSLLTRNSV